MFDLKNAITWEHSGKMEGMFSLSTSCTDNALCKARQNIPGCVCQKCYAESLQNCRTNCGKKFRRNGKVLKNRLLTDEEIQKKPINAAYFRFEAFGDLETVIQVKNYFRICELNPAVHFTLWTKNPFLIADTLKEGRKVPKNLKVGFSSPMVDMPVPYEIIHKIYPFISFVFTVYHKDYAQKHHIRINCGGNHCFSCLKCYKSNRIHVINEILK